MFDDENLLMATQKEDDFSQIHPSFQENLYGQKLGKGLEDTTGGTSNFDVENAIVSNF